MSLRLLTRSAIGTLVLLLAVASCVTEDDVLDIESEALFEGQPILLGKKLQNPFSVSNMRIANENIKSRITNGKYAVDIRPTHLYVRFLPKDYTEFDKLINDTSLVLTDHPLDYEILQDGDFYHDPSIPDSKPTYQYATIPAEYISPAGIDFEILDELYLPQNDSNPSAINGRTAAELEEFADALEDEALNITGNTEHEISKSNTAARSSGKWEPAGRITVWDTRLKDYIPVPGAKIRARRWFDVKEAITDESGYYKMKGSFRYEASYSIVWERDKFDIRSGTFGQAKFNGPKMKGDWNLQIERNGMSYHYAHVFRAAMRYYYGDIGGLKRPSFRIKYAVFNKKGNHINAKNIGNWSTFGINPNVLLYRYNDADGTENDSDEMFSATCHETAHATHMQVMKLGVIQFAQVSINIRESWAIGVEWFLTQKEYKEKGIANYGDPSFTVPVEFPAQYSFQYWNKRRNTTLTSLFIDLVDRNNQAGQYYGSFSKATVTDQVAGYTLAEIESTILIKVYGLNSLSEELKSKKPAEITDKQIDLLLQNF